MQLLRLVFFALIVVVIVSWSAPTLANDLFTPKERKERLKKLKERREKEWLAEYRAAPQRKRRRRCAEELAVTADGEGPLGVKRDNHDDDDDDDDDDDSPGKGCVWEGLQVFLAEGMGLQACADCADPSEEGLYGEWDIRVG